MNQQKIALNLCCALLLMVSGCSRQQSDWQKTRETNTTDAYEQFLKKYPGGQFNAQAEARVKELYEERDWQKARDADTPDAYQAFLKQYPEGKWTEEARIRVENFTLAQAPSGGGTGAAPAEGSAAPAAAADTPSNVQSGEVAGVGDASGPAMTGGPATRPSPVKPSPAPAAKSAKPSAGPSTGVVASNPQPGSRSVTHSFGVQLGAFKSGAQAAHERWAHLQKEYPSEFAGLKSKVVPKTAGGATLYRLQAVGLTEKHARSVCSALKAKSQPCVVVPPAHG